MTALRQQAYRLLDALPEEKLFLVIDILQAFKHYEEHPRDTDAKTHPLDFSKYMGRGEKMFPTTAAIDGYIRESRNDRC